MAIYYVLGVIFILAEVVILTLFIRSMVNSKMIAQKENIKYFVPIFVLLYIMYLTASFFYNKVGFGEPISLDVFYSFSLINFVIDTFAFKINTTLIYPLVHESVVFLIAYLGASILACLTTVLTVTALLRTRIGNYFRRRKAFAKNCDILVGDSASAVEYYEKNGNCLIWDPKIDSNDYVDLLNKGFIVCREKMTGATLYNKLKKGEHHLILFRDSGIEYSEILKVFEEASKIKEGRIKSGLVNKEDTSNLLYLHIESTVEEMQTLRDRFIARVDSSCNSFVTCFNKYELLARDFVVNYPITKYIPRDFFNENLSLKKNKKINVALIGFGNINKELFSMMSIHFQFANCVKKDGVNRFESAPVNYYIYDKDQSNLVSDSITKLEYDYNKIFKNSDLPPFDKFCNVRTLASDVNSAEVRKELEKIVDDDSFTYFIVSLAGDLENVAYAESLQAYFSDKKNIKVFARVKEEALYEKKCDCDCPAHELGQVEFFGRAQNILTHKNIVNEELIELSQRINHKYMQYTRQGKNNKVEWEKLLLVKQYSNMYQALNMFFKLGILGFWAVKKDIYNQNPSHYSKASKEDVYKGFSSLSHKDISYDDYFKTEKINLIGFIEHSRWVAFHFLRGYKPLNFDEVVMMPDGTLIDQIHGGIKKHICLTSNYEGLDKIIRTEYLMQINGADYKKMDIYKQISQEDMQTDRFKSVADLYYYDFMVMEDLYDVLTEMDYVIVGG